jgi:hypothetical protein
VDMTLVRMVSVTRAPTVIAPRNSIMLAMSMACLNVREREATEVAKELATSLAPECVSEQKGAMLLNRLIYLPMFHASRNAKIVPMANR